MAMLGALLLAGSALATTAPAPGGAILPIGVQELPSALYGQQSSSDQSKHADVIGLAVSTSAETSGSHSAGDKKVRVVSTSGYSVGSIVRLSAGASNQEDVKVQYVTGNSLWLASPLEFNHNRGEAAGQLSVNPECPGNCSSRAPCVNAVCECPAGFSGEDCSVVQGACADLGHCHGHGYCLNGGCHCNPGFTGSKCDVVRQLCPFNCSGHGICSNGVCSCEPGFGGATEGPNDCSIAAPDCINNCTGHGSCTNGEAQPAPCLPPATIQARPASAAPSTSPALLVGGPIRRRVRVRLWVLRRRLQHRRGRLPVQLLGARRVLARERAWHGARPLPL